MNNYNIRTTDIQLIPSNNVIIEDLLINIGRKNDTQDELYISTRFCTLDSLAKNNHIHIQLKESFEPQYNPTENEQYIYFFKT